MNDHMLSLFVSGIDVGTSHTYLFGKFSAFGKIKRIVYNGEKTFAQIHFSDCCSVKDATTSSDIHRFIETVKNGQTMTMIHKNINCWFVSLYRPEVGKSLKNNV